MSSQRPIGKCPFATKQEVDTLKRHELKKKNK